MMAHAAKTKPWHKTHRKPCDATYFVNTLFMLDGNSRVAVSNFRGWLFLGMSCINNRIESHVVRPASGLALARVGIRFGLAGMRLSLRQD